MQFGTRQLELDRPRVMGILNVTPDSFSDGGLSYGSLDLAVRNAARMMAAGAEFIDIGGESTRPGASPVSEQEELDRVIPVVERIATELDVIISVDTSTPAVIAESAACGAGLINDVRALGREGALAAAATTGLPVCLMHMKGSPATMQDAPEYDDVLEEVSDFLMRRMTECVAAGFRKEQLILDPGFGFGKTLEHNLRLLNNLEQFHAHGVPLLAGISRKSMIGQALNREVDQRLYGSLAAAAIAAMKGAQIIRVHDVEATVDVIRMCHAVAREQKGES
ncbi:MAG: dihydropteroate synthase [Marinobacterium sp.]|nr:dihydropteroate synthase [Marinobacterium sp.]